METLIVHLTDIHIQNESDLDFFSDRTEIIGGTICNHITTPDDTCVVFCVTGDFAYSGKEEQFTVAAIILDEIFSVVKRRYPEIVTHSIFVPGNHDCDFENPNSGVRNVVLKSQYLDISDINQMKQCTSIQENFFSFAREMDAVTCEADRVLTVNNIYLENSEITLSFHCINTSWCSEKNEQKGKMKFKYDNLPEKREKDIIFTLMHHDAEWLDWEDKEQWNEYHKRYSDIILVGHDHEKEFVKKKNYDDTTCYHIKGNQLYDTKNPEQSGFNILKLNIDTMKECFFSYELQQGVYKKIIDTGFKKFERNRYIQGGISLRKNVLEYLDSLDIDIRCKSQKDLSLSDIFAFPTLKEEKKKGARFIRNIAEAMDYFSEQRFIVLEGRREYGKTALLKYVCKTYFQCKKYPVFIDVNKITTAEGEDLNRLVAQSYSLMYENIEPEEILVKERNDLICLIDNLDSINLADKTIKKVLQYLTNKFGIVIVTRNNELSIIKPISYVEMNDYLDEMFSTLIIRPVGSSACDRLVNKWLMLDENNKNIDDSYFDAQRKEKYSQIQAVMKKNFFNRTPMDLLLVLSYLDQDNIAQINYSRYSYIYDGLIVNKFTKIANNDSNTISVYKTILEKLAYEMFISNSHEYVDEQYVLSTIFEYKESYSNLRLKAVEVIEKLVENRFLENVNEKYSFKYSYMYYYFVSSYIEHKLSPQEKNKTIYEIFENLDEEVNYNVALFLTYGMNKQYEIIPIAKEMVQKLLTDFETFKYEDLTSLIIQWGGDIEKEVKRIYTVPENKNIPELRKKRLQEYDEYEYEETEENEDKYKPSSDELQKINVEVIKLSRLVDFLGNVIKNYSGELDNSCREEVIDIMFKAVLKIIGAFCKFSVLAVNKIIDMVLEKIKEGDEKDIDAQNEFAHFIKKLFAEIWFRYVCLNIMGLACALECDMIKANIDAYSDKNTGEFSKMVRLEYLFRIAKTKLPVAEINNLFKGKNAFSDISQGIMKNNIYHYLSMYQYEYRDKQAVCSQLKFDIKDVLIEEKKNLIEKNK